MELFKNSQGHFVKRAGDILTSVMACDFEMFLKRRSYPFLPKTSASPSILEIQFYFVKVYKEEQKSLIPDTQAHSYALYRMHFYFFILSRKTKINLYHTILRYTLL